MLTFRIRHAAICLAGAVALAACSPPAGDKPAEAPPASAPDATPPASAEPAAPPPVITGGYAPADASAPGYKEAETLAVDEIYKREPQRSIVESKSAEVQVVAGLNFRFDIKMSGQNRYTVVVYRDLQGKMEVTEFTKTAGN